MALLDEPAPAAHKTIYWHRELPPLDAELVGEHEVESVSETVPYHLDHKDTVWAACHANLMATTERRLDQELRRLGGTCAHVVGEAIVPVIDQATSDYHLKGRFTYLMYR